MNNRNHNSDSSPNRGDNSSNTQRDTSQNNNANQGCGYRTSLVCTYPNFGLSGHKEEDCRLKADDLHPIAFKDSMVNDVKAVVENVVTDRLKALGFPPGQWTGS